MVAANAPVILVVDDDPDLRETLVDVLEGAGYITHAAEHGAAALSLLRDARELPALILLDMMMPVMGGQAFAAEVAQDSRLARIPIIVCTARPDREALAAQLHAAGSLNKPLQLDQLLSVIKSVIDEATGARAPAEQVEA